MHGNIGRNADGSPRALGPSEVPSALNASGASSASNQTVGSAQLPDYDPRVRNYRDG